MIDDPQDSDAPEPAVPPTDPPPPLEATPLPVNALPEIPPPPAAPEPSSLFGSLADRIAARRAKDNLKPAAPSAMFKVPLKGDTGLEQSRMGRNGAQAARVDHIVELMTSLQFVRGKTAKVLARKWHLELDYVHTLTAMASKIVRESVLNKDQIQIKVTQALDKVLDSCLGDNEAYEGDRKIFKNEAVAIQNRKCLIEAARTLGDFTGAGAPKRSEISGPDGGPIQSTAQAAIASLTPEQVDELLSQAAERRKARNVQAVIDRHTEPDDNDPETDPQ